MADLAEVLDGIREEAATALNTEGLSQPSQNSRGIRIYRGWPGEDLDADLVAGVSHVTIFPRAGIAQILDGDIGGWHENPRAPVGMTATVDGEGVTLAGADARSGLIATIVADRRGWTVPVAANQTAASVAAALVTVISADREAILSGNTVILPGVIAMRAGVYSGGTERLEVRRQEQGVLLTVWAPSAALRDRIAGVLDLWFAENRGRLTRTMPDQSRATYRYGGTVFDDAGRAHPLYRRDLALLAEYTTNRTRELPPVAAVETTLTTKPEGAVVKVVR